MNWFSFSNRIFSPAFIVFFTIVMVFAPFSPSFRYVDQSPTLSLDSNLAEAGGGGSCVSVTGGPCAGEATALGNLSTNITNTSQNTISAAANTVTSFATNFLSLKEGAFDGFAWYVIDIVISEMIASITDWVNAGFPSGGPAFIRDFRGFMLNIADGIAGDFILENTNLGFMCSPFQLDIKLALTVQYLNGREPEDWTPQCRVTDILRNLENFTINIDGEFAVNPEGQFDIYDTYNPGSFAAGGWVWWMEATAQYENNIYGTYVNAQNAMAAAIAQEQGTQTIELDWGRGFLTMKQCDDAGNNCKTTTPGAVIQESLQKALGAPQDRLVIADEINELVSALLGQLLQQVLGELGLFGLSFQPFAPDSGNTFNEELRNNREAYGTIGYSSSRNTTLLVRQQASEYLDLHKDVYERMTAVRAELTAALEVPGFTTPDSLPPRLVSDRFDSIQEIVRLDGNDYFINQSNPGLAETFGVLDEIERLEILRESDVSVENINLDELRSLSEEQFLALLSQNSQQGLSVAGRSEILDRIQELQLLVPTAEETNTYRNGRYTDAVAAINAFSDEIADILSNL